MDKFDELPDDIMLKIISPLGMKSAAQTSILSKRWRYLPTYLTDLDFAPETIFPDEPWYSPEYSGTQRYVDWVNQVVSMHRGSTIDRFRVTLCGSLLSLDRLVKFALSKKVKELFLRFSVEAGAYTLGVDILSHPPCDSGIEFLKSLHLEGVTVAGEVLQLILGRCHLLERLHVKTSFDLVTLKVNHCKLKYLTLSFCKHLKEFKVHACSLEYFEYTNYPSLDWPEMVFESVPALIEAKFSLFPWLLSPVFQHISCDFWRLSKLTFRLEFDPFSDLEKLLAGVIPLFPHVITLELEIECMPYDCILPMKHFIKACPVLRLFTLMVDWMRAGELVEEAEELLQVEESEDAIISVEHANKIVVFDGNPELEDKIEENETHGNSAQLAKNKGSQDHTNNPNLNVFHLVGFRGCSADVRFLLHIVDTIPTKTIICDPRDCLSVYDPCVDFLDSMDIIQISRRRARKLASIVEPKTKVVVS